MGAGAPTGRRGRGLYPVVDGGENKGDVRGHRGGHRRGTRERAGDPQRLSVVLRRWGGRGQRRAERGLLTLEVDMNGDPTQDWLVWANPRIAPGHVVPEQVVEDPARRPPAHARRWGAPANGPPDGPILRPGLEGRPYKRLFFIRFFIRLPAA